MRCARSRGLSFIEAVRMGAWKPVKGEDQGPGGTGPYQCCLASCACAAMSPLFFAGLDAAPAAAQGAVKLDDGQELVELRLDEGILRRKKQLLLLKDFVIAGPPGDIAFP